MSATATLVYRVNATGLAAASLAALIDSTAVPIPAEILAMIGGTIASDVTVNGTRTIVWNLTGNVKIQFPDSSDQRDPFWDLMTYLIEASCCYPVLADAPVLA